MKVMAGRKWHSAEDIVRKLRRVDELAAEGKKYAAVCRHTRLRLGGGGFQDAKR